MTYYCHKGCFETKVDIQKYASGPKSRKLLTALKREMQPCEGCGKRLQIRFSAPHQTDIKPDEMDLSPDCQAIFDPSQRMSPF